jgi:hypothetical protein
MVLVDSAGQLDLRRLSKALQEVDPALKKQLAKANQEAAKIVVSATKSKLNSGGDPRFDGTHSIAAAKRSVIAKRDAWGVAVEIGAKSGSSRELANAVFWGMSRRSGWFAGSQYDGYTGFHQGFAEWVGSGWGDLASGKGPYFVSPAIAENKDKILAKFAEGVEDAMRAGGFK